MCGMYDIKKAKPNFPKIHQQSIINPSSIHHQSIINPSNIQPKNSPKVWPSGIRFLLGDEIHIFSAPHRRIPGCVGRSVAWPGYREASVRTWESTTSGDQNVTPTLSFVHVSVYRYLSMYQYLSIFIDIYQWLSMVINGYQWLSMVINVYQCLSMFVVYQRSSTIENHFPKHPG